MERLWKIITLYHDIINTKCPPTGTFYKCFQNFSDVQCCFWSRVKTLWILFVAGCMLILSWCLSYFESCLLHLKETQHSCSCFTRYPVTYLQYTQDHDTLSFAHWKWPANIFHINNKLDFVFVLPPTLKNVQHSVCTHIIKLECLTNYA